MSSVFDWESEAPTSGLQENLRDYAICHNRFNVFLE